VNLKKSRLPGGKSGPGTVQPAMYNSVGIAASVDVPQKVKLVARLGDTKF